MRILSRRRTGASVVALLATATLAACGSGSSHGASGEAQKSAQQILADAVAATQNAGSVHVSGSGVSSGEQFSLDVVATNGKGGGGTVGLKGGSFQMVVSGTTVYLKASSADWTKLSGSSAAGQALGGKWLSTTTDNPDYGQLASFVDLNTLVTQMAKPSGTVVKQPLTTVDGIKVIPLHDTGDQGGTLDVAATGSPLIVELSAGGGGDQGSVKFDQYGKAQVPPTPSGAVSLDSLINGQGG